MKTMFYQAKLLGGLLMSNDSFQVQSTLSVNKSNYTYYCLQTLAEKGYENISRLPFSIKVLLEAALRGFDGKTVTKEHIH